MESPSHVVIVFELMEGGDLSAYLNARGNTPAEMALSEEDARPLFHQVLSAVGYAHNQHICHRDLKLENILLKYVNSLSVVKVADFGLSDFYRPGVNKKSYCGTLAFIAPEVFKGTSNAGPPLDIWSMGVILFAALCGRLPFDPTPNQIHDNRPREQIIRQKIVACQYKIDEKLGPEAKDLVRRMLKVDPTERASIPEIFNHVWLRPISNTIIDFTPTTTSSALSSMNSGIPGGGVGVSGGPKVSSETVASEGSRATVDGRSISPASVFGVKGAASISQASRNSSFNYNADNAQFTPHLQDSIDVIANPTSEDARDGESVGKTRSVSSSRAPSVSQIEGCSSTNDLQADEVDTRTSGVTTPQLSSVEPVVRASSFIASSSAQPSSFKLVPLRRQVDNRTTSRDQLDELDELYVNVNQALVSQSLTDSLSPAPSGRIGATAVDGSQRPYSTHTSRNHSDHVSKSNNSSSRARTPDFATSISSSRVLRSKLRNEQLAVNHSLGSGTGFGQSSTTNAHVGTKYTTSPNQRQRPAVNRGLRSFTTDGTLDFEQSLTPPPSYNSAPSSGKYMK